MSEGSDLLYVVVGYNYTFYLGTTYMGRATIYRRSPTTYSAHTFIKPEFRGQGYGRKLYNILHSHYNLVPSRHLSRDARRIWHV